MLHVLVVEDNDALREGIVAILEAVGYTVTAVASGKAGVRAVTSSTNLLLLDWQLPDIYGDVVLTLIRQRFPTLPCIFSSAQTRAQKYALLTTNTTFLQKPYDIDDLLHMIEQSIA